MRGSVQRSFPAQSSALRQVRRLVEAEAAVSLPDAAVHDLLLAVTEACSNAVRHSGTQRFVVTVSPAGGCVEVSVEDDGIFLDARSPTDGDEGHRGLDLIDALVDAVSLRRGTESRRGTTVRMRKCRSSESIGR
jgi:serine/threonine-protein kinase RsbW